MNAVRGQRESRTAPRVLAPSTGGDDHGAARICLIGRAATRSASRSPAGSRRSPTGSRAELGAAVTRCSLRRGRVRPGAARDRAARGCRSWRARPPAATSTRPPTCGWPEHHAYLGADAATSRAHARPYDVVHNNSLHHLPVAMAPLLHTPVLTTLHTPPIPWLESAIATAPATSTFVAVSRSDRAGLGPRRAEHAGPQRRGHPSAGRPVPEAARRSGPGALHREKAPHLAIDAARAAGLPIVLAGPISDEAYFEEEISPRLGVRTQCTSATSTSAPWPGWSAAPAVAVVTPAWDEPFGLVAAEAMACGTPVAAYDRGRAVGDRRRRGRCARAARGPGRPRGGHRVARRCDRASVRAHAVAHHSVERMVTAYEHCYAALGGERRRVIGYYVHHVGPRAPAPGPRARAGARRARGGPVVAAASQRLGRRVGRAGPATTGAVRRSTPPPTAGFTGCRGRRGAQPPDGAGVGLARPRAPAPGRRRRVGRGRPADPPSRRTRRRGGAARAAHDPAHRWATTSPTGWSRSGRRAPPTLLPRPLRRRAGKACATWRCPAALSARHRRAAAAVARSRPRCGRGCQGTAAAAGACGRGDHPASGLGSGPCSGATAGPRTRGRRLSARGRRRHPRRAERTRRGGRARGGLRSSYRQDRPHDEQRVTACLRPGGGRASCCRRSRTDDWATPARRGARPGRQQVGLWCDGRAAERIAEHIDSFTTRRRRAG